MSILDWDNLSLQEIRDLTDPAKLDRLSYCDLWFIRTEVVNNPNTEVDTLIRLVPDIDSLVRAAVARNPKCPPIVRLYLQSDYRQSMTLKEFLEAMS